ncbi:MAG: hypothetical protein JRJ66_02720 [Deltaproteobacteria bacterium]|nr:hypothetical protein [Deltaproteobacteria bacterium]MBW2045298.1 hypothetical protein [Deltaproteobacteria bacterium]
MQVLITITKGIINRVTFFEDPAIAVQALSGYVKTMNPENDDAALYDSNGLIANAKHFLAQNDKYRSNETLIEDVSAKKEKAIYIICNPTHHLGFMVASPDDPVGFHDPLEALALLETMRQDFGSHLKLYKAVAVEGPVVTKNELEQYYKENEIEDQAYSLIEEYVL